MAVLASSSVVQEPTRKGTGERTVSPRIVLAVSLWCGLVAGLLEVAVFVIRKRTIDPDQFYRMSRHFIWLIPMTDLLVIMLVGGVLALAVFFRPALWPPGSRLLATLTLLPAMLVAFPRIHGAAWLILAVGLSMRLVPVMERHPMAFGRLVRRSLPCLGASVLLLGASIPAQDAITTWRWSRLSPPKGPAPNVLLVVLDTVAAGHLSLHGYDRPTSPTLEELAESSIRFDAARSTSSWTLPSHASLFTGRWPHELSTGWLTPLDATHLTLAEYLRARGYETAGFVGNTMFCAEDSGLARGFSVYRDHIHPRLTALKTAALVDRLVSYLPTLRDALVEIPGAEGLSSAVQELWLAFSGNRKDAATVHREFLDWLTGRPAVGRPFFAFLNDFDAHVPYELPPGRIHRFGARPQTRRQEQVVRDWWPIDKQTVTDQERKRVGDLYDDCIADLDEQVGRLLDELQRRRVLDSTWLILTADHGESFGEHAGVYCHGTSLYQTELHVPLLIRPPGGVAPRVVSEPLSLRDLPATVAEIVSGEVDSPFPGRSLCRYWRPAAGPEDLASTGADLPLSEVVPIDPARLDPASMLRPRWPLGAVADSGWTYIRREGEVREELFHVAEDPRESRNRASEPADQARLARLRSILARQTAGPLTPQRFRP